MKKDPKIQEHVRMSLIGCRIFYFSLYALFYLAVALYPNDLTNSLKYTLFYYLPITVVATTLFIKAGDNPGFVDETKEPESEPADNELGVEMRSLG